MPDFPNSVTVQFRSIKKIHLLIHMILSLPETSTTHLYIGNKLILRDNLSVRGMLPTNVLSSSVKPRISIQAGGSINYFYKLQKKLI